MAALTEAVAEQTEKLHHAAYLLENDTESITLGYRNGVDSSLEIALTIKCLSFI